MAYKKKVELRTDTAITLGGTDESGKVNQTKVEGYYLGSKTIESDFGPGKLHIFQTEKGNIGVWGKTHLNSLLSAELAGMMVLVTFEGMQKPAKKGRRPSYSYSVQYDEDNKIDVSGISATEDSATQDDTYSDDQYDSSDDVADVVDDTPAPKQVSRPTQAAAVADAARREKIQALLNDKK